MNNHLQKTISDPISLQGVGLHSGKQCNLTIYPGIDDQGIVFKRVDLKKNNLVEANFKNVSSAKLCTTLQNNHGVKVSTVEHLLAALYISEIDNAIIELDNEEVPIMDGSAKNFLEALKKTKIKSLTKKRNYIKILKKEEFVDGERNISIEPCEAFEVDFQIKYQNKIIGDQRNIVNFNDLPLQEVSESRTFCLFDDIEKIKKLGLAKGGSLENAIVVDKDKVLNETGLRNEKEFVNHKILDLAGDFFLSGGRILGKVKCSQGGHELTNMFLRKLFSHSEELDNNKTSKKFLLKNSTNHSYKVAVNA
tara:strand:- start:146 stop:1066 length:921 start_codon:yes stop_codon:yes gene_type:complete